MIDPIIQGLMQDVRELQQRLDNLTNPEVPLGFSLLSEQILSGSVASITFSNISQYFRHLRLISQLRTDRSAEIDAARLRLNGDTGSNYDEEHYTANSTTVSAAGNLAATSMLIGATEAANSRSLNSGPLIIDILNYRSASEKWVLSNSAAFGNVSAATDLFIQNFIGRWRGTAAITSLTLIPNTGPNFVSGCTIQLYGLR